jgi:hypothetical protein
MTLFFLSTRKRMLQACPFFLFTIVLALACCVVQAQDISTSSLNWDCASFIEKHSNNTYQMNVTVTTIPAGSIEIHYPTEVLTFTIDSTDGQWSDVTSDGQLIYHVKSDGITPGKVTVRRSGTTTIEVDFREANDYGMYQVFEVSQVSIQ